VECLTVCKALSHVHAKGKRALIPKVGLLGCFSLVKVREKSQKSEISARDLQKPFEEFKTINSILLTKYCSQISSILSHSLMTKNLVINRSLRENNGFANCNTSLW